MVVESLLLGSPLICVLFSHRSYQGPQRQPEGLQIDDRTSQVWLGATSFPVLSASCLLDGIYSAAVWTPQQVNRSASSPTSAELSCSPGLEWRWRVLRSGVVSVLWFGVWITMVLHCCENCCPLLELMHMIVRNEREHNGFSWEGFVLTSSMMSYTITPKKLFFVAGENQPRLLSQ